MSGFTVWFQRPNATTSSRRVFASFKWPSGCVKKRQAHESGGQTLCHCMLIGVKVR